MLPCNTGCEERWFGTAEALRRHLESKHMGDKLECTRCRRNFYSVDALCQHTSAKHFTQSKPKSRDLDHNLQDWLVSPLSHCGGYSADQSIFYPSTWNPVEISLCPVKPDDDGSYKRLDAHRPVVQNSRLITYDPTEDDPRGGSAGGKDDPLNQEMAILEPEEDDPSRGSTCGKEAPDDQQQSIGREAFDDVQQQPLSRNPVLTPVAGFDARNILSPFLLPEHLTSGPTCSVDDFCTTYQLDHNIRGLLKANGYSRTHTFKYVQISELDKMGFKSGEVAEMREAVRLWASPL